MEKITIEELSEIIQNVHRAVDQTDFGPVYSYSDRINPATNLPDKIVSPIGAQVFVTTLQQVLSNIDKIRIVPSHQSDSLSIDN